MSLIAFPTARVQRPIDERTCECGSTWFQLERVSSAGMRTGGVVQVGLDGEILSYSGDLICNDCGKRQ